MRRYLLCLALILLTPALFSCAASGSMVTVGETAANYDPDSGVGSVVIRIDEVDGELLDSDPLAAMTALLPDAMRETVETAGGDTYSVEHSLTRGPSGAYIRSFELSVYGADYMNVITEIARANANIDLSVSGEGANAVLTAKQTLKTGTQSQLIDGGYPAEDILPSFLPEAPYRSVYISSLERKLTYTRSYELTEEEAELALEYFDMLMTEAPDAHREETAGVRLTGTVGGVYLVVSLTPAENGYTLETDAVKVSQTP